MSYFNLQNYENKLRIDEKNICFFILNALAPLLSLRVSFLIPVGLGCFFSVYRVFRVFRVFWVFRVFRGALITLITLITLRWLC